MGPACRAGVQAASALHLHPDAYSTSKYKTAPNNANYRRSGFLKEGNSLFLWSQIINKF